MEAFKRHIAKQLIGQKLRFKCDCFFGLDGVGIIRDFDIIQNEIVFTVESEGTIIKIGENHPNLYIDVIR